MVREAIRERSPGSRRRSSWPIRRARGPWSSIPSSAPTAAVLGVLSTGVAGDALADVVAKQLGLEGEITISDDDAAPLPARPRRRTHRVRRSTCSDGAGSSRPRTTAEVDLTPAIAYGASWSRADPRGRGAAPARRPPGARPRRSPDRSRSGWRPASRSRSGSPRRSSARSKATPGWAAWPGSSCRPSATSASSTRPRAGGQRAPGRGRGARRADDGADPDAARATRDQPDPSRDLHAASRSSTPESARTRGAPRARARNPGAKRPDGRGVARRAPAGRPALEHDRAAGRAEPRAGDALADGPARRAAGRRSRARTSRSRWRLPRTPRSRSTTPASTSSSATSPRSSRVRWCRAS